MEPACRDAGRAAAADGQHRCWCRQRAHAPVGGQHGLKLCGKGEWLLEKHGTATRRSWRTLHLGVDAGTGQLVASTLTPKDVDDASQAGPLLDQAEGLWHRLLATAPTTRIASTPASPSAILMRP